MDLYMDLIFQNFEFLIKMVLATVMGAIIGFEDGDGDEQPLKMDGPAEDAQADLLRELEAQENPKGPPDESQQNPLPQKLAYDEPVLGSQRLLESDLPLALRDHRHHGGVDRDHGKVRQRTLLTRQAG